MKSPNLWPAIIIGSLGVGLLVAGVFDQLWAGKSGAGWAFVRILCVALGAYLLICAGLMALNWAGYHAGQRMAEIRRALSNSERVRALDIMSRMTIEQIAVARLGGFTLDWVPGGDGTAYVSMIRTPGGEVPGDFFEEFMGLGDDKYLAAVGSWSEGTNERTWAQMATNMAIGMGWAIPARGPYPAAWINKEAANRLLERIEG